MFKNEFFNNFPTYRYFLGSEDIRVFLANLQFGQNTAINHVKGDNYEKGDN